MTAPQTVTIKDVAKLAGVSISTASRALTGAGGVRPTLESKIVEAATKLNYRPNAAARGLRKAKTATMGIVFNNLRGPGQLDLLKGVGTCCNTSGFGLLAADANGDHALYLEVIRGFFEQRVEGLFLMSPIDLDDSLADYRRHRVPVIALMRKDASAGSTPIVGASEKHALGDAAAALRRMGHRNIAYVFRFWDDRRVRELTTALMAEDLKPSPYSYSFQQLVPDEEIAAVVRRALVAPDRPTALFVPSEYLGAAFLAINELKMRLPDDLSLVSVGSSSWHQLAGPGIAAVEADNQSLGRLACSVMLDWIGGQEPHAAYSELAQWKPASSVGSAPALNA